MIAQITVNSLQKSAQVIAHELKKCDLLEVFDWESKQGFTFRLKLTEKPIADLSIYELKREYRKITAPEPHDILMTPWRAIDYVGIDLGLKSSSFGKEAA